MLNQYDPELQSINQRGPTYSISRVAVNISIQTSTSARLNPCRNSGMPKMQRQELA